MPITFSVILPPNPCSKNLSNFQINPGTLDENKNSKVCTIKTLWDSSASELIIHEDVLYICHKIFKDKKKQWSTMAGNFKTISVPKIILKVQELNHSAEIYAKCHLTNKLLNYNLILGRDILHKTGINFNFEN